MSKWWSWTVTWCFDFWTPLEAPSRTTSNSYRKMVFDPGDGAAGVLSFLCHSLILDLG